MTHSDANMYHYSFPLNNTNNIIVVSNIVIVIKKNRSKVRVKGRDIIRIKIVVLLVNIKIENFPRTRNNTGIDD